LAHHLLQEHQVGGGLAQGVAQLRQDEAPVEPGEPLVGVDGQDADRHLGRGVRRCCHVHRASQRRSGSAIPAMCNLLVTASASLFGPLGAAAGSGNHRGGKLSVNGGVPIPRPNGIAPCSFHAVCPAPCSRCSPLAAMPPSCRSPPAPVRSPNFPLPTSRCCRACISPRPKAGPPAPSRRRPPAWR